MLLPPPSSTLFPYTTLFRSRRARQLQRAVAGQGQIDSQRCRAQREQPRRSRWARQRWERSEEHTSELQSRLHLVCRLLLEKKKKKNKKNAAKKIEYYTLNDH